MKTVLILGAGVTRAAASSRSTKRLPPLDRDFFQVAAGVSPKATSEVLRTLDELLGEYAESIRGSLETATTYLYLKAMDAPNGSTHHITFLNLLKLLNSVLAQSTNSIRIGPRSLLYRFLHSELERVSQPQDLTIITFNYDLLIERALQEIAGHGHGDAFAFPGCYRIAGLSRTTGINGEQEFGFREFAPTGISVLKLHGSLNWQSRHTSSTPTPTALFNQHRELHVINAPKIPSSLTWTRNKRTVYMKPVLIPPISGKRGMMHKNILPLWNIAAKCLRECDRVVIAGYSCPPLDLETRILLSENLTRNEKKRVYVIDPVTKTAARFSELCAVGHVTIYDGIEQWVTDAPNYP